jgi:transcriptional regulator with XRE-family HTH domain
MPFVKGNIKAEIEERKKNQEFAKAYEIIETIVKMRKESGRTQPELAEITGISQQSISRMEKVGHSPTLRNFLKYLDGAGLELEVKKKGSKKDECQLV